MAFELRIVQFWSEIILVISNRTRFARSFDFEIMRIISDQIALHSQLPSWIPPFDQITITRYLQRIKPRKVRCKKPLHCNYKKEKMNILTLIFFCYKLAILVILIYKCYINVDFCIFRTCSNRWTSVKNAAAGNCLGKI